MTPRRRWRRWRRGPAGVDEGSGTVLVLGLVAVLLVGALATASLGRAAAARHRAASAADLSALASAGAVWDTGVVEVGPCAGPVLEVARTTATRNGARLGPCTVGADASVRVQVTVPVGGLLADTGPARAAARAGPADP